MERPSLSPWVKTVSLSDDYIAIIKLWKRSQLFLYLVLVSWYVCQWCGCGDCGGDYSKGGLVRLTA